MNVYFVPKGTYIIYVEVRNLFCIHRNGIFFFNPYGRGATKVSPCHFRWVRGDAFEGWHHNILSYWNRVCSMMKFTIGVQSLSKGGPHGKRKELRLPLGPNLEYCLWKGQFDWFTISTRPFHDIPSLSPIASRERATKPIKFSVRWFLHSGKQYDIGVAMHILVYKQMRQVFFLYFDIRKSMWQLVAELKVDEKECRWWRVIAGSYTGFLEFYLQTTPRSIKVNSIINSHRIKNLYKITTEKFCSFLSLTNLDSFTPILLQNERPWMFWTSKNINVLFIGEGCFPPTLRLWRNLIFPMCSRSLHRRDYDVWEASRHLGLFSFKYWELKIRNGRKFTARKMFILWDR